MPLELWKVLVERTRQPEMIADRDMVKLENIDLTWLGNSSGRLLELARLNDTSLVRRDPTAEVTLVVRSRSSASGVWVSGWGFCGPRLRIVEDLEDSAAR